MERPQEPVLVNSPVMEDEYEIDLLGLMFELLDKVKYIIIATMLGALIAAGYSFFMATPIYEAVAKIYVLNSDDSVVNLSDLQLGSYLAADYVEVFKTWEVSEMVRSNLNLHYSYGKLSSMVKINNPADTRVLYITAQSSNAKEATLIANEYATVISNYVEDVMDTDRPNTLSVAIEPANPISPNKVKNVLLGILAGMFLSIAVITLRYVMDDSIRSPEDITRYTGCPVLAIIPMQSEQSNVKSKKKRGENS